MILADLAEGGDPSVVFGVVFTGAAQQVAPFDVVGGELGGRAELFPGVDGVAELIEEMCPDGECTLRDEGIFREPVRILLDDDASTAACRTVIGVGQRSSSAPSRRAAAMTASPSFCSSDESNTETPMLTRSAGRRFGSVAEMPVTE